MPSTLLVPVSRYEMLLSRRWRHAWCSIPDLKFEDSCVNLGSNSFRFSYVFTKFVSQVVTPHQGPVRKFVLHASNDPEFSDIAGWMSFVSNNGVEELSLECGDWVTTPSCLFQCEKLTALSLFYFESLEIPVGFNGFMLLKSLVFKGISIAICSLVNLISGCPLLENLELDFRHSEVLKIHAQRLKYLILFGHSEGFVPEKSPLLEEISVTMIATIRRQSSMFGQFINRVPFIRKLVYPDYLIQGVRRVGTVQGPTTSCSCFWSEAGDLGCEFLQLKKMALIVSGSSNEIELMKFILLNSPVLETMTVTPSSKLKVGRTKVLVGLLRCRRASPKAEIVFIDQYFPIPFFPTCQ